VGNIAEYAFWTHIPFAALFFGDTSFRTAPLFACAAGVIAAAAVAIISTSTSALITPVMLMVMVLDKSRHPRKCRRPMRGI
jgi:hypothetical protein